MSDYWFILGSKSGRKQYQNIVLTIHTSFLNRTWGSVSKKLITCANNNIIMIKQHICKMDTGIL